MKNKILYAFLGLSILANLILGYLLYSKSQAYGEVLAFKNQQIAATLANLDSVSAELDQKIDTIALLQGDVNSLYILKNEIEAERQRLARSNQVAWQQIEAIRAKVDFYKKLLLKKDAEIKKLKSVNSYLLTENTDLKVEKEGLKDSLSTFRQKTNLLGDKVKIASRLFARNIQIETANTRGKKTIGTRFKTRRVKKLYIHFNIVKNDVASLGGKDIYLRIIDPKRSVILDNTSNNNTFKLGAENLFFTLTQKILFDNSEQRVSFEFDKKTSYEKGVYQVELYTPEGKMGETRYTIY